jgi:hypothetical protein
MTKRHVNEIAIDQTPVAVFEGRFLFRTCQEGEIIDGVDKSGQPVRKCYSRGAYVLSDAKLNILAGPISLSAASVLALEIVSGNQRVLTEPGVALRLAVALLASTLDHITPGEAPAGDTNQNEPLAARG